MTALSPVLAAKRAKILEVLGRVGRIQGALAEFGVFRGSTLQAMALAQPRRICFGFDTFAGMPADKCQKADGHKAGDFGEVDFEAIAASMPANVRLVRGTFPESAAGVDPAQRFAFAHLDFDLYLSMKAAIAWILPRLERGGILVFDDWRKKIMPGVDAAIAEAGLHVAGLSKHQSVWIKP